MMTTQICLPDDLAREAKELGLLELAVLAEPLRETVRRSRIAELFRLRTKWLQSTIRPSLRKKYIRNLVKTEAWNDNYANFFTR